MQAPGTAQDRHAAAVRRQPAAPARLSRNRASRGRLARQHRFRDDQVFWIGVYPGLGTEAIDYMVDTLHQAVCATQ